VVDTYAIIAFLGGCRLNGYKDKERAMDEKDFEIIEQLL